jgi:hypothetical protein
VECFRSLFIFVEWSGVHVGLEWSRQVSLSYLREGRESEVLNGVVMNA